MSQVLTDQEAIAGVQLRGARWQQATGTSGTIISIGEAFRLRASEDERKTQGAQPAGDEIVLSKLARFNSRVADLTIDERRALPGISAQRSEIIVAGGRGIGGPAGFELVEQLAGALGGAVGASRAAVDSGWISYSKQIGQTGKIVKPELYLALGISGAIQHKVGMQSAGTIVAVNRDPDAPIADFADLLVVGDLFEVGTALLELLRSRSS